MKIELLDKQGKKIEDITLEKGVFGVEPNIFLLNQYLHVYRSNQRQGTASTKTRGEISGGGKKPWRQKGTGRARHGSTRSPIWRHGGVAHGPKPKSWRLKLSKGLKRKAMQSALSICFNDKSLTVIDSLVFTKPSAKDFVKVLNDLKLSGKTLFVLKDNDTNLIKSSSNLDDVKTTLSQNVNVFELMNTSNVVFLKDSLLEIQEKYK